MSTGVDIHTTMPRGRCGRQDDPLGVRTAVPRTVPVNLRVGSLTNFASLAADRIRFYAISGIPGPSSASPPATSSPTAVQNGRKDNIVTFALSF